jgi:deoxyadenosine/deoxycytidine kinase
MFDFLSPHIPSPDLLICLSTSDDLLISRIQRRNREFEQRIDPTYYRGLNTAYEKFFDQYPGAKLRICMNEWDFIANPNHYAKLSRLIDLEMEKQ